MSYQTVSATDSSELREKSPEIQTHHTIEKLRHDDYEPSTATSLIKTTECFRGEEHKEISEEQNENMIASTSKWKIGWKQPLAMVIFYSLAFLVAVAHLLIFHFLDGKYADGRQESFPQTYVTSISILLANIFQASLGGSLAVAFTQHLWRVLRTTSLSISSIDSLHRIRRQILPLLHPRSMVSSPLLYMMALSIWLLSIAKIFPPGALTVISRPIIDVENSTVPTYDSRYIGNASIDAAGVLATHNFDPIIAYPDIDVDHDLATSREVIGSLGYTGLKPSVLQMAVSTLVSGEVLSSTSPCGPNCSYTTNFEGPYLYCTEQFHNETSDLDEDVNVYEAAWNGDPGPPLDPSSGPDHFADFHMNLSSPIGAFSNDSGYEGGYPRLIVVSVRSIVCQPSRASYTLNTTFVNGRRTLSYKTQYLGSIEALFNTSDMIADCPSNKCWSNDIPLPWTRTGIDDFGALNVYGIIDCMVAVLTGWYPAAAAYNDTIIGNFTLSDGRVVDLYELMYLYYTSSSPLELSPSQLLLRVNIFNHNRDTSVTGPNYIVTQDLLNEGLANITFGIALTFGHWSTGADVTTTTYRNVYSFSRPLNLILPYSIALLIVPIFLLIGANSLRLNGVPAMDDSFVQLLMTTTGSRALENVAAVGCLGGTENVPKGLKRLKVRYGELAGEMHDDPSLVKRAGFGLEDEVRPLTLGALYGR